MRRADAAGAFSGPMRANVVAMLDGVGLAGALGIDSTARLFDSHHHLAAHVSAIEYPVFVNGRNYGGTNPALTRHPVLRSLVRASLGPRLDMAPGALVVPLGKAAQGRERIRRGRVVRGADQSAGRRPVDWTSGSSY